MINKNEFDKAEELINKCRRKGLLPVDFVAEEDARAREEAISSGLQFIEAGQGSATCAKCQTPVDPISLLTDWKEPEE